MGTWNVLHVHSTILKNYEELLKSPVDGVPNNRKHLKTYTYNIDKAVLKLKKKLFILLNHWNQHFVLFVTQIFYFSIVFNCKIGVELQ